MLLLLHASKDNACKDQQARSQGGMQGAMHPQKSAKRFTFSFSHQMGKKWGFCSRVEGDEAQKVHFSGPKGPLLGVLDPPKSILATNLKTSIE